MPPDDPYSRFQEEVGWWNAAIRKAADECFAKTSDLDLEQRALDEAMAKVFDVLNHLQVMRGRAADKPRTDSEIEAHARAVAWGYCLRIRSAGVGRYHVVNAANRVIMTATMKEIHRWVTSEHPGGITRHNVD